LLIKTSKPECVWKSRAFLGEGVSWILDIKSVFFVDIIKKKIFIFNTKTNKKKILKVKKEIGFILPVQKNIFLQGLKSEIRIENLLTREAIISLSNIDSNYPNNRINDGKIDPAGRLWFGTMNHKGNGKIGSLYCLDNNLFLQKVDGNYLITNGPAFIDKFNFYHTDTRKKIIYKIRINKQLKIIKKKIFIKFGKSDGSPDGMTTDINNNLWVCHYHGGKISVYNLKGRKIHEVKIPAKNITNCTFGGEKYNELFVSTARKGMNVKELKKYPLSGGLFKLKTNIRGKKAISFKYNYI